MGAAGGFLVILFIILIFAEYVFETQDPPTPLRVRDWRNDFLGSMPPGTMKDATGCWNVYSSEPSKHDLQWFINIDNWRKSDPRLYMNQEDVARILSLETRPEVRQIVETWRVI